MSSKKEDILDGRAYRVYFLAEAISRHTGMPCPVKEPNDWTDTATFRGLTIQCHPEDPEDPDKPWQFAVHTTGGETRWLDADTPTDGGGILKGGNLIQAAHQIIAMTDCNTALAGPINPAGAGEGNEGAGACELVAGS